MALVLFIEYLIAE